MPGTTLGAGVRKEKGGVRAEARRFPTHGPSLLLPIWMGMFTLKSPARIPVTMTGTWTAKELTRKIKLGAKTSLVNAAWMRKHGLQNQTDTIVCFLIVYLLTEKMLNFW